MFIRKKCSFTKSVVQFTKSVSFNLLKVVIQAAMLKEKFTAPLSKSLKAQPIQFVINLVHVMAAMKPPKFAESIHVRTFGIISNYF